MSTLSAAGPNAEQIEYWNEQSGRKWVELQDLLDAMIRPLGLQAMQRAGLRPGDQVLDVGCGCGDTTLELAARVAPGGAATGLDISTVMLERARRSAAEKGIQNANFINADAQTHDFGGSRFDVLFSRFGVMFFADPTAAFTNLHRALEPGARLAFVCWQALSENPWMFVPMMAALPHLPPLPIPAPDAPGPFAFANPDRVRSVLGDAGFSAIELTPYQQDLAIAAGAGVDQAVDFVMQMGPTARVLKDAETSLKQVVARSIGEAMQPYYSARGVVMPSATWIVTARA